MGVYRLDRAVISVSGPDTAGFLDNLLTQNVKRLTEAGVLYAGLLSPQGKLVADMMLWAGDGGVLIELDPLRAPDLVRRLNLYKLRANFNIATTEHTVLWRETQFEGAQPDPRFPDGTLGWRKLAPHGDAPDGATFYRGLRIAEGVPDLVHDAEAEEVFALEALMEELNGVDFQKGCFIGQENVSRMKRRATTRRKFCPLDFDQAAPPKGTPVLAGEVEIGSLRASAGGRALALLRLDRASGAKLSAGGRPARLAPPAWLLMPKPG